MMTATTANPATGTMTLGGSATADIGLKLSPKGHIKGTVYLDNNKNAQMDGGESGIANCWVGVTTDGGVTVVGYALTNASGAYDITVPANDPPRTTPYTVYVVPPANTYPTSTTAIANLYVANNANLTSNNFGMANYTVITLNASRVLSLAAADLVENDAGKKGSLHQDVDLVLGADAAGTDNITVWFNQYNSSPVFNSTADYTRLAPQSVLAMAVDTLDMSSPIGRPDLVTGTKYTTSGNFFVWFNQNTSGNEGYFPTTYSTGQAYKTADNGDVQTVRTLDVLGGSMPDIIVGTKSATANQGSIEIWTNSNAATPTFSRAETYTTVGAANTIIGEVNQLILADLDGDGLQDLVAVTRTGTYSGQLIVFRNLGKSASGNHFQYKRMITYNSATPTAVAATDVDGDGRIDLLVGTQTSTSSGTLMHVKNLGSWFFLTVKTQNAPGIVMSMAAADMGGGSSRADLIVGYRTSTATYAGGVAIYYLDVSGLPDSGVDPSGGSITSMVPAMATANFNYGVYPTGAPTPYLTDLAVGVKQSASTGSLVIFIR
mgnify:CR=1 FL=1